MNKPDGGQAFPLPETDRMHHQPGLSIRDYFAGIALRAWLDALITGSVDDLNNAQCATQSYKAADAMLAEREKAL